MILSVLNAGFAYMFGMYAYYNVPKGLQWLRVGWFALQVNASKSRENRTVENQRAVSEGGKFVIGGAFSLVSGIIAAISALIFAFLALYFGFGGTL